MLSLRSPLSLNLVALWKRLLSLLLCSICWLPITACQPSEESVQIVPPAPEAELTPPPPPNSAFLALLPPEQTAQIRAMGTPLVVPTAIPAGFRVEQVEVGQSDRPGSYQILYRDERDRCFLVEYTAGESGDLPQTQERIAINPPLVESGTGLGLNYGRYSDPSLASQSSRPVLFSDWLPINGGFYRLLGATYANELFVPTPACQEIAVEEAVAIVESSAVVTEEIQGDGMVPPP
jgi:hypothetical protein